MLRLPSRSDPPSASTESTANASTGWDAVLELYYAELCEYTLRFVGSAEVAEDIVQDLFLHLWRTRGPKDEVRLTKPYLYTSARHRALKYLRHRRVAEGWIERASHEEAPGRETPSDVCLRHELEEVVEHAIAALPGRCREIFLLRRRDQLSYDEIAARMGVSLGTVKSQMWHAATTLRAKLAPYLVGALSLVAHAYVDSILH
jgi:RNA polymerase sigma-70 factor, ECF subfamily